VQLSVVYGREIDGGVVTFGTTGYTYDRTFVLYDRKNESLWYPHKPSEMNGLCGPYAGSILPFLAMPERMRLADWRDNHADSLVLARPK
jgi:hypothetical protein